MQVDHRPPVLGKRGIAEVWRFNGKVLRIFGLGAGRRYNARKTSAVFPEVPLEMLQRFLQRLQHEDENELIRDFTAWVRAAAVPLQTGQHAPAAKRNGVR